MANRDTRRAAKRRTKRNEEKRERVERTGPTVSIDYIADEYEKALAEVDELHQGKEDRYG